MARPWTRPWTPIARACALLAVLALAGCKVELYSDLSEREANQIVAALMEVGIPAAKEAGRGDGVAVSVDEGRFAEAMAHLNARGLPNARYESFGDVFQKDGLVSSPVEERARYVYALSQELSRTIAEIDGVLSARIHVVLPETDMLGRDMQPSSASVFIRHSEEAGVERFTSQIKMLVANSIEGLVYDNVSVVSVPVAAREAPDADAPVLRDVAGVWVHPSSEARLWATLGGMAALSALSLAVAGGAIVQSRRRARAAFEGA